MGDIIKAIREDMDDYVRLCKKYGEEVQTTDGGARGPIPDCYGAHAEELKKREENEKPVY